jgi:hypothetical protein
VRTRWQSTSCRLCWSTPAVSIRRSPRATRRCSKRCGPPGSAYFGGGPGHLGSIFEERDGHRVAVRLRFDDLIRFSPAASLYVARLRELVRQRAITLDLTVGEGYVLLNDRWLHGRRRFLGDRMMLRLIGDPLPEYRMTPGFLPTNAETSLPVR